MIDFSFLFSYTYFWWLKSILHSEHEQRLAVAASINVPEQLHTRISPNPGWRTRKIAPFSERPYILDKEPRDHPVTLHHAEERGTGFSVNDAGGLAMAG